MASVNSPKKSMYIALMVGALFLAVIIFQQANTFTSQSYINEIEELRDQKDLRFKNDPKSPIPKSQKATFKGLSYYPVKEKFKVEAKIIAPKGPEKKDTLKLLTTTGDFRPFLAVGKVGFKIDEKPFTLTAYEYLETEEPTLFVPFTDETTGEFTYGGGRYLDVPLQENLVLDFNQAYNPYCVYNEEFSCPIPPRENHLDIRILAGENISKEAQTP